jgi:hypothetical protein
MPFLKQYPIQMLKERIRTLQALQGRRVLQGVRGTDFVQNAMGIHEVGLMHTKRWLAGLHHANLGEELERDFPGNPSHSRSRVSLMVTRCQSV